MWQLLQTTVLNGGREFDFSFNAAQTPLNNNAQNGAFHISHEKMRADSLKQLGKSVYRKKEKDPTKRILTQSILFETKQIKNHGHFSRGVDPG